jgi:hypothetical protein
MDLVELWVILFSENLFAEPFPFGVEFHVSTFEPSEHILDCDRASLSDSNVHLPLAQNATSGNGC